VLKKAQQLIKRDPDLADFTQKKLDELENTAISHEEKARTSDTHPSDKIVRKPEDKEALQRQAELLVNKYENKIQGQDPQKMAAGNTPTHIHSNSGGSTPNPNAQ
jgi:hypothetical protein